MSARLYIPRVLTVVAGAVGVGLTVGGVRAVVARVGLLQDGPGQLRPAFAVGLALAGVGVLLGLLLLRTAARWATFGVVIDASGVRARLLTRRVRWSAQELKGIVLRQDGGIPQLRLVPHDGDAEVFPGWSLRARWQDGEVDDAGPVLQQLGAELGFRVRHRTLLSSPPAPPPPRPNRT